MEPTPITSAESDSTNPEVVHRRFATHLVSRLRERHLEMVFGIPGGAISGVYDALYEAQLAAPVDCRHESAAVFMAVGYYRACQRIAVVLVTSGPGVTNAITGIASAFENNARVLVIAGEAATAYAGRGALQDGSAAGLNVVAMVTPVTRLALLATHASAVDDLERALDAVENGPPGPVFLSLPMDVAASVLATPVRRPAKKAARLSMVEFASDAPSLQRIADHLRTATRGLIVVGNGAAHPDASRLVRTLAEACQIPVATSPKAKGLFPENHPLALGVLGFGGHSSVLSYLNEKPDVILTVGCGLRETCTNGGSVPLRATRCFARIDLVPQSKVSLFPADIEAIGDAAEVLASLTRLVGHPARPEQARFAPIYHPVVAPTDARGLHPADVIRRLQANLPDDVIWTSDIGEHLLFALHYTVIGERSRFIADLGLGSMGTGIGAAVGIALGCPDRKVVCICGDYGFQMYGSDILTAAEHPCNLLCVVFNDGRMGMVENGTHRLYGRSFKSKGLALDFTRWASASATNAARVGTLDQLPDALKAWQSGVTLLDVEIDPTVRYSAAARDDLLQLFSGKASTHSSATR